MHRTLGDFLTDIFQNSVEAGAKNLRVTLIQDENSFRMEVADDGCGMTAEELVRAQDPFYTDGTKHSKRRVGLGLPFLIQTAEMTGGEFGIESKKGEGTNVKVVLPQGHVDIPPEGDWAVTLSQLFSLPGDFEAVIDRQCFGRSYQVSRKELIEVLGSLEDLEALILLKQFFLSAENEISTGINEGEQNG